MNRNSTDSKWIVIQRQMNRHSAANGSPFDYLAFGQRFFMYKLSKRFSITLSVLPFVQQIHTRYQELVVIVISVY